MRGQFPVIEQHPHLGVEIRRTRVQVERAHETTLVVDHERLGVQAGAAAAEQAAAAAARATRAQFVQVHAIAQQWCAIVHVAAVHGRDVIGGQ
ncbi:hypothetical protein D9M71_806260 [compost metagenome]